MSIALAGAPVSFGVWGPHTGPAGVGGAQVLEAIAAAGYAGSELGPHGYLGDPDATAAAFTAAGLQAAGVYVGLHLSGPGGLSPQDRAGLDAVCRTVLGVQQRAVDAGAPAAALPLGPVVLADEGSSALREHPARATSPDPAAARLGLDDDAWRAAATTIAQAQELIGSHGLATSFHPHLVTLVESRAEVERLLETTGVGVTLDTGHLQLAGADPVDCLRAWGSRVDHVHLKDVDLGVLGRARRAGRARIDDWWGSACVPFGHGDVDLTGVVTALVTGGYAGWVVVEQDHTPAPGDTLAALGRTQRENLERLVALLEQPEA